MTSPKIKELSEYQCHRYLEVLEQFPIQAADVIAEIREHLEVLTAARRKARQEAAERQKAEFERKQAAQAAALAEWEADPLNEASMRGWQAMKNLAPGLDGVQKYSDLPPSLRCRYAAFTRAVLNLPQVEEVVLSLKQEAGRTLKPGETELPARDGYGMDLDSGYYCCEDCG